MSTIMTDVVHNETAGNHQRKAFATWEVKENTYRMKLTTAAICDLEEKFKTNIMNLIGDEKSIPSLSNMLYVTHAAMKDYHHGIKLDDVKALYDSYINEGGSLVSFFIDVFMPIYQVSGFFTESLAGKMDEQRSKAKKEIL
ncbi:hypothetical protein D5266_08740 [bacterium c-19]|nr:hypothetical protein [bacterium c-19]